MMVSRSVMALTALAVCSASFGADAVQWRVADGGNGHWYQVVQYGIGRTHAEATTLASQVGARLVSIGSEPENAFVESLALPYGVFASFTLGGAQDLQAPDYSEPAGGWRWDDGTTWGFTNWDCGVCAEEIGAGWWCQPDNYIDQHYLVGVICMNRLVWDDGTVTNAERRAIYEWSADCNNDGLVDYGQILSGELADSNGNNIPDICDCDSDSDGDGSSDCADQCPTDPGATTKTIYFIDADGDGYGTGPRIPLCTPTLGYTTNNDDCDDTDPTAFPRAIETCGNLGVDNDCDGDASDTTGGLPFYRDGDCDGAPAGLDVTYFCAAPAGGCWIPVGPTSPAIDCDDADPTRAPGAAETCANDGIDNDCDGEADRDDESIDSVSYYIDADQDGFGSNSASAFKSCTPIPGTVTNNADCDDMQLLYADNDGDGYGASVFVACGVPTSTDCNDADPTTYPDAPETCANLGTDNDCDGEFNDTVDGQPYYFDSDCDGWPDAGTLEYFCFPPTGGCWVQGSKWIPPVFDCDDTRLLYADTDGDTFGAGEPSACGVYNNSDCNDADPSTYPGAPELCANDGIDNNCNGEADRDDESINSLDYYVDADGDSFGSSVGQPIRSCTPIPVRVPNNLDCDDTQRLYTDNDGDGFGAGDPAPCGVPLPGDCEDADPTRYPDAPETCANDGTDNDCDGEANRDDEAIDSSSYYIDADSDGFGSNTATAVKSCTPIPGSVPNNDDCDDTRILYADNDGDGSGAGTPVACGVPSNDDCDDTDPMRNVGAQETCADEGTDNDCDGDPNDWPIDPSYYYADNDGDGFGAGAVFRSCTPIPGRVPNNVDCDDTRFLYTDNDNDGFGFGDPAPCGVPTSIFDCDDTRLLYTDADGDGFGEGLPAPCGVPNNTDCDDGDPAIGASADVDRDGRVDCRDVELRMDLGDADLAPGGTVVVRVSAVTLQPVVHLIALQCSVQFDAQRLLLVDAVPVKGSPLPAELVQSVDQGAGTLVYALGALPPGSLSSSSALFDLVFTVRPEVDACSQDALLARFEVAGQPATVLLAADQSPVTPSLVALAPVDFDITAPVIANVPAPMVIPADAGNAVGAVVAEPAVLADDACGEAFLSVHATLPNGAVVDGWPTGGVFPVGTTQLVWRAVDGNGNAREASSSIAVLPYQLLDATFELAGAFPAGGAPFTRSIRMSVGTSISTTAIEFAAVPGEPTRRIGRRTGIAVPVSSSAPCALAKDAQFSITDAGATSVSGTRYATEFTLLQGDSNDDDVVDIYDYGLWYIDVGAAARTDRSNFNADAAVNNGDFGWIVLHFLRRGDSCGGTLGGVEPVQRVSAKELRRRGLGALLAADINRDGWLDARDVQLGQGAAAQPVAEGSAPSW